MTERQDSRFEPEPTHPMASGLVRVVGVVMVVLVGIVTYLTLNP